MRENAIASLIATACVLGCLWLVAACGANAKQLYPTIYSIVKTGGMP